jgi:hypothetical protein
MSEIGLSLLYAPWFLKLRVMTSCNEDHRELKHYLQ